MIKKLFLTAVLIIGGNALELDFTKTFETMIEPNTAATKLTISVKDGLETQVTSRLEAIATYINGYRQVEKEGGNFRVQANYFYNDGQREQDGFIGSINYKIFSQDIDNVDMFLEDLLLQKENENIEVQSYGYEVNPKNYSVELEKLRFKSIIWGIAYAKDLSAKIFKKCEVKEISFTKNPMMPRVYAMEKVATLSKSFAPKPIKKDEKVTLSPKFVMECE